MKEILLNKKVLYGLSAIVMVAAAVTLGTGAFFSDTETSTGNTFTAGAIDLKVDSNATYNGAPWVDGTWGQQTPGVDITSEKFFNFTDIKPGDYGENTISLHVINNDAWVCAEVSNLVSADNSLTEPEAEIDLDGLTSGELDEAMVWKIWRDDGDNIWQAGEPVLAEGNPVNGVLPIYDSTTGAALGGGNTTYLGVSWSLPDATGNEVQTDSLTGDISFNVVQSRNNEDFQCVPEPLAFVLTDASEQNALNEVSQDKPWYTYVIDGLCIDFTLHNPTTSDSWFDFQIDEAPGTFYAGLSDILIDEGPLNGQYVGNLYGSKKVLAGQTEVVEKCGTSEIKVGIHFGPEQLWYLDWATFTAS